MSHSLSKEALWTAGGGGERVCQRSDTAEHQKGPAGPITRRLPTAGSSQSSAGLSFTDGSFRTAGGRWDPRHLLHRAGNMLRRQGHTPVTSHAAVMWSAAVAHLERLRTHLCSTAAANTLRLRREVQGPPGVLPAELVVHSGQVPRPWEQVVRGASRDVVSCQRQRRRHGQVTNTHPVVACSAGGAVRAVLSQQEHGAPGETLVPK